MYISIIIILILTVVMLHINLTKANASADKLANLLQIARDKIENTDIELQNIIKETNAYYNLDENTTATISAYYISKSLLEIESIIKDNVDNMSWDEYWQYKWDTAFIIPGEIIPKENYSDFK